MSAEDNCSKLFFYLSELELIIVSSDQFPALSNANN